MPSVEMRRSTRVFVPKTKDGQLVRVLRSGRRLGLDSSTTHDKTKHQRSNHAVNGEDESDEVEWFPIIAGDESFKPPPTPPQEHEQEESYKGGVNGWHREEEPKAEPPLAAVELMDVDEGKAAQKVEKMVEVSEELCRIANRVIKNVYSRKRKRSSVSSDGDRSGRKFGLHFVRRHRRRSGDSAVEKRTVEEVEGGGGCGDSGVLSIVIESNCGGCSLISRLMESVLRHLGSRSVGLEQLSAFLVTDQISNVFVSFGIRFLWNRSCVRTKGVCRIFGERDWIPLFTVDFSALPLCFLEVHAALLWRSLRDSCLWWMGCNLRNESINDDDEPREPLLSCCDEPVLDTSHRRDVLVSSLIGAGGGESKGANIVVALECNRVGCASTIRNLQHRNGVLTRNTNSITANNTVASSTRSIGVLTRSSSKRRRRSLRNRRARNPLQLVMQKASGPPVSNNVVFKKKGVKLPAGPNLELRRSARRNPTSVVNVPKSSANSVDFSVDVESQQCCSGNLLVVETDKCYRVEGAQIVLDLSASNEWVLAVRKDGMTRYSLKVQKEMRPSTINRVTHAVIWSAENGWKLEFPNRKDWAVFKELYKECGEKNIVLPSPVVKFIPIPEVSEVAYSGDSIGAPFERPDSYIRMMGDELSRILLRRSANYDMDSEDEEWLSKFNAELDEGNLVSDETFELMIDAFEKASYCSPEVVGDEKAAVNVCLDLVSSEVVEPVYRYWMKRRKQKRAPLLRVFELNEQKREVIAKPVLRKKRSLKRTTSYLPMQRGRGKDSNVLQALAAEQTVAEEQNAVHRLQEARASAASLVEVAIQKRQRAQFLMENADLAIYRATMALRIAESASQVDTKQAAAYFLD